MKKLYSDSRWHDDPKFIISKCGRCKHYRDFGKCDAFPEGIPESLFWGDHTNPYKGDNGIRFEPKIK